MGHLAVSFPASRDGSLKDGQIPVILPARRCPAAPAALVVGLGLLAAAPTALTGWAEWAQTTEQRDRRVGIAHAAANSVALGLYAGSWLARRGGRHGTGVALGHLAAATVSAGGFLGAHLAIGRKVGTDSAAAGSP